MHYKNGREAKNGDKVMWIPDPKYGASPCVGILYNATAGQDYCNGQLALVVPGNPTPNLKECLHIEDALKALVSGQDSALRELAAEQRLAQRNAESDEERKAVKT